MLRDSDLIFQKWILENATTISLSVLDLTWVRNWSVPLYDMHATAEIRGVKLTGRGSDVNRDTAVIKSVAELIERSVVEKGQNSSGFAVHTNLNAATDNARCELLERDMFLCHFHTATPFRHLDGMPEWTSEYRSCFELLQFRDIKVTFFYLGQRDGFVFVGTILEYDGGGIIGLGSGVSNEMASHKSFVEAMRHLAFYHARGSKGLSLDSFRKLRTPSFTDHGRLLLDKDYFESVKNLFYAGGNGCESLPAEVEVVRLEFPIDGLFSQIGLYAARAVTNELQPMYLGMPNSQSINSSRLSKYGGIVNKLPHPLH